MGLVSDRNGDLSKPFWSFLGLLQRECRPGRHRGDQPTWKRSPRLPVSRCLG